MKLQFVIKLSASAAFSLLIFGCAVQSPQTQSRAPTVVLAPVTPPPYVDPAPALAPAPSAAAIVTQESGLDKNEIILDKPAPAQPEVLPLLARISATQQDRIAQALREASSDPKVLVKANQTNINQAMPKMRAFVERLGCIKQYNDGGSNALQPMAAPDVSFKFFVPPMHGTKAHNKNACLTVSSITIQALSYQGAPAIQIKVSFLAEDSGERTTSNHEINKNKQGVWWFTR